MKHTLLASALFAAITLSACEKPTVVNVPAPTPPATVVVPGPPGAPGATGATGATGSTGAQGVDGNKGEPGKPGDRTTVIVTPPPPAPRN